MIETEDGAYTQDRFCYLIAGVTTIIFNDDVTV